MANELSSGVLFRLGLASSTDLYNTDPTSDIVKLTTFSHVSFLVHHGTGATGTATFTVEACSDNAGAGAEAVTFTYRVHGQASTQSSVLTATTAGYTITAGSDQLVLIEREKEGLPSGKPWVRLKCTEVVDSPVAGFVLIALSRTTANAGDFPDVLN